MVQSRRDFLRAAVGAPLTMRAQSASTGINSIIDIHHARPLEPGDAKSSGVVAIIHKATEGIDFRDKKYLQRKAKAKAIGLLWGAYHFANGKSAALQATNFLRHAEPEDDEVVCLDFEHNNGNEMSLTQAEEFVLAVRDSLGRLPMIYGGAWLREQVGGKRHELLGQCPLWYRRYAPEPRELPTQIWPTYTLWQYTDGQKSYGGPSHTVNGVACNRSLFQGTEQQIRLAWPFTRRGSVPG